MAQGKYIPKFQGGGGVSLSSLLAGSAKGWAAKNLAKKDAAQRKKEGTWASIMALLKPVAGFLGKAGTTALGVTNPYLLPLLYGGGTAAISKAFDVIGREFGAGADPSKIEATGKYGYGKEAAKTLSEGLAKSIKERDPFSGENIGADIVGSYVSALTPKIVPTKEGGFTVEGGELGKTITEDIGKWKEGKALKKTLSGIGKQESLLDFLGEQESFATEFGEGGVDPLGLKRMRVAEDIPEFLTQMPSVPEEVIGGADPSTILEGFIGDEKSFLFEDLGAGSQLNVSPPPFADQWTGHKPSYEFPFGTRESQGFGTYRPTYGYEQGGQVSKYYGGGSVSGGSPTIAGYFNQQGKTLGGSNTQSLSQKLGRR